MTEALDNYGKPRRLYFDRLKELSDDDLRQETNQMIWLSAYANNNARSDYHWKCDATYAECQRRGKPEIYSEEHARLMHEASR